MRVSIVIPNYNGEELLGKNLPKILDSISSEKEFEIIIVDDASSDNSVKIIEDFIKDQNKSRFRFSQNSTNLGFSSTVNRGVGLSTGEILILLNTDVIPKKGFIEPLLKHFKDESVFAVGCMDESIEGNSIIQRGRGVGKWERGFMIHSKGSINKENTLWVSGGSGAFRKSIWDKLGGLDELYNPFYWEDIDLSYRARKSGYLTLFDRESVVIHEHAKGAIKSKYSSPQIRKISYRNQFIFVWKNVTDPGLIVSHLMWLPYHLIRAALRRDWPFFSGFMQAFIKLPAILKRRQRIRKMSEKSDRAVFDGLND